MHNTFILFIFPNLVGTLKNYISIARHLWTVSENVFRKNQIFWVTENRYEVDIIGENAVPNAVYNM